MPRDNKIPDMFQRLYTVLSSDKFLNREGLGGELPFFIQSFLPSRQTEVDIQVKSLINRLSRSNVLVSEFNLYEICISILKEKNLFDRIVEIEGSKSKSQLLKLISGPLNIDSVLIPYIQEKLTKLSPQIVFLTGIGAAYPMIRSHTILNNLQTVVTDIPLVMFFPGTYNNQSLILFDIIKDDNYYRAHNLNAYNI